MAVWNSFPDVDLDWWGWRWEEENNNMIYFNTLFNWILLNSFREVVQGATSTAKDLLKVNQQQAPKTWPTVHFLYLHFFFCFLPQGMREIYTSLVREGDVFDYFFGNFRIIVICFYDSYYKILRFLNVDSVCFLVSTEKYYINRWRKNEYKGRFITKWLTKCLTFIYLFYIFTSLFLLLCELVSCDHFNGPFQFSLKFLGFSRFFLLLRNSIKSW